MTSASRDRRARPARSPSRASGSAPSTRRRARASRRCRRRGTRGRSTRPSSSLRSRVTPGFSSTIASRRPTMRFTSVDLPTFGPADDRDDGRARSRHRRRERSAARATRRRWRRPRPGAGGRRRVVPSRKRPSREHDVGQEVAVAVGLVGERGGDVGAGEQPGDADVAAEEPVRRPAAAARRRRRGRELGQRAARAPARRLAGEDRDGRGRRRVAVARADAIDGRRRAARGSPRRARRRPTRRSRCACRCRRRRRRRARPRTSASNVRAMPMPFSCCGKLVVRRRAPGTAGRRAGSTRRTRTRGGGRARRGSAPASARRCRARPRPRRACAARISGSWLCALTPSGHDADASRAAGSGRARRAACRRAPRRR